MWQPTTPSYVMPVAALTWSPAVDEKEVRSTLVAAWGRIALESEAYEFDAFTHYYSAEMGTGLLKRLVAFTPPLAPDDLATRKIESIDLERLWQDEQGNRRVNIDPGYLTPSIFVLASTKYTGRRIYLRDGIYAEITLWFERGAYRPLPWTYSDYRQDHVIETLAVWRTHALAIHHSSANTNG
jgi:hypothetical protein